MKPLVAAAAAAKSLQSCLTLCDPIDGSPPGSPIPGILQARTLQPLQLNWYLFSVSLCQAPTDTVDTMISSVGGERGCKHT